MQLVWREECKFRHATCYKCQKKEHIQKVCKSQTLLISSTAERQPDESLLLMSFTSPSSSKSSFDKQLCDSVDIPISRLLCGKNMALTEEHGMEKNFQKLNGELRISTRPNEKCLTVLTELNSPNNVTEFNANICAIHSKCSELSCTEARQQPLEGNAQETARGEAIQATDLLGDNAEDVDADLQREPLRLMHKPNHVFALSGTSVSAANGERDFQSRE